MTTTKPDWTCDVTAGAVFDEVQKPPSLPSHSTHSQSEYRDGRHTCARVNPAHPLRPPCFADPDLYRAHQSKHYGVESDTPGCRLCEPPEVAS